MTFLSDIFAQNDKNTEFPSVRIKFVESFIILTPEVPEMYKTKKCIKLFVQYIINK